MHQRAGRGNPEALALVAAALLTLSACADGGSRGEDAGGRVDGGPILRVDGGGPLECAAGQHLCGSGCIDDLANEPANGCRLGCGEPCPTPPDGAAACDAAGACVFECPPPFRLEGGACVCEPSTCEDLAYACGAPDDGCGTPLDCGVCEGDGECMEGVCACPADAQEPNDSRAAADAQPFLAMLDDSDDAEVTFDTFGIDGPEDQDWYRVDVVDGGDGGAPVVMAWLDDIPTGSNYDLAVFWTCDSGTPGEACDAGMPDDEIGYGCASASSGTTSEYVAVDSWCGNTFGGDPGVAYVRVTASTWGGSCAPYSLRIRVE